MTVRQVVKDENEIITFGMHKNSTFRAIMTDNPSYIVWLNENEIVSFPKEMLDKAESLALDKAVERRRNNPVQYDPADDYVYGGCDPNMWGDIGF